MSTLRLYREIRHHLSDRKNAGLAESSKAVDRQIMRSGRHAGLATGSAGAWTGNVFNPYPMIAPELTIRGAVPS